jgi:hypothetical protein
MSIFSNIIGAAAPIVGGIFGGPVGAALGGALGSALSRSNGHTAQPGTGMIYPAMGAMPAIGAAAGTVVRIGAGAVSRFGRGAISLCRRYPQWCSTIGGTAAVAALLESGQLPMPRRRRGRGISGRDLRAYRRIHNVLAGFCAPKARIRKVC